MMTNRELDALVAEKVMGWTNIRGTKEPSGKPPNGKLSDFMTYKFIPNYSTDIKAAWGVIDRIDTLVFELFSDLRHKEWTCKFSVENAWGCGETAPRLFAGLL